MWVRDEEVHEAAEAAMGLQGGGDDVLGWPTLFHHLPQPQLQLLQAQRPPGLRAVTEGV